MYLKQSYNVVTIVRTREFFNTASLIIRMYNIHASLMQHESQQGPQQTSISM